MSNSPMDTDGLKNLGGRVMAGPRWQIKDVRSPEDACEKNARMRQ